MPPQPLAARMRPRNLDEVAGQEHLLAPGKVLREAIDSGELFSMILWGPPGCGKTTLGFLIAQRCDLPFHHLSAVTFSVKELHERVRNSEGDLWEGRMVLFLDEIHRLNKAQQDVLLPHVESGRILLIGATTENPAFEVNRALLSRCRVFRLEPVGEGEILALLHRALNEPARGLGGREYAVSEETLRQLIRTAGGDARASLTILEAASHTARRATPLPPHEITGELVTQAAGALSVYHDKGGEEHYNVISAFIKSMRGGDPDATLYYLARMLEGGEDPGFILRRMLICASEDVGLADPVPLMVAAAAAQAFDRIGLPEGALILAHAALTICLAPKSNSAYKGIKAATAAVRQGAGRLPVPLHLHGAQGPQEVSPVEYLYPHDHTGHHVQQTYLPDAIADQRFFEPGDQGREQQIRELLARWWNRGSEPGEE